AKAGSGIAFHPTVRAPALQADPDPGRPPDLRPVEVPLTGLYPVQRHFDGPQRAGAAPGTSMSGGGPCSLGRRAARGQWRRARAGWGDRGGREDDVVVSGPEAGPAADLTRWPSVTLAETQLAALELLLSGAFAPLRGYLEPADAAAVAIRAELAD